jgi:hypothetical protein
MALGPKALRVGPGPRAPGSVHGYRIDSRYDDDGHQVPAHATEVGRRDREDCARRHCRVDRSPAGAQHGDPGLSGQVIDGADHALPGPNRCRGLQLSHCATGPDRVGGGQRGVAELLCLFVIRLTAGVDISCSGSHETGQAPFEKLELTYGRHRLREVDSLDADAVDQYDQLLGCQIEIEFLAQLSRVVGLEQVSA